MNARTEIGVVTVSRSDYSILKPILEDLRQHDYFELCLYVTGMHLAPEFGKTVREISENGFKIFERIESLGTSDDEEAIAETISRGIEGFSRSFSSFCPDAVVLMGDRFEMFAPGIAALPFNIPLVHIHGGEITKGAIDNSIRHSLTKLCHLHCTSTRQYQKRVIQMGEQPERVYKTGAPGLDNIRKTTLIEPEELEREYNFPFGEGFLLVTFHPVTTELNNTDEYVDELVSALEESDKPVVVTAANADAGGQRINEMLRKFAHRSPDRCFVKSFGGAHYYSVMNCADAMVGNSSSGIIEAASFDLPVVNIGMRQEGRVRGKNVIDVVAESEKITKGIQKAVSPEFRSMLDGMDNPYGDGYASARIIDVLENANISSSLVQKDFFDLSIDTKVIGT